MLPREKRAERGGVRHRTINHCVLREGVAAVTPAVRATMHPARVVARAGTNWRTSVHKGNPLFRRWAPAANTLDRDGSPDGTRDMRSGNPSAGEPKQEQCNRNDRRRESLRTRAACAHLTEGWWLGGRRVVTGGSTMAGCAAGTAFRLGLLHGQGALAIGIARARPERTVLTITLPHRRAADGAGW